MANPVDHALVNSETTTSTNDQSVIESPAEEVNVETNTKSKQKKPKKSPKKKIREKNRYGFTSYRYYKNPINGKKSNIDTNTPETQHTGRRRCVSMEEAIELIKDELLESKSQYERWWDFNMPRVLPKYPERSYQHCWISWSHFLSKDPTRHSIRTVPSPKIGTKYRSFTEARKWVHHLQLKAKYEWVNFVRSELKKGTFPIDIPTTPHLRYVNEWVSWNNWLGTSVAERINSVTETQTSKISKCLFIARDDTDPSNVYHIQVINGTEIQATKYINEYNNQFGLELSMINAFNVTEIDMEQLQQIISTFSSKYCGEENIRILPNLTGFKWEMNIRCETLL